MQTTIAGLLVESRQRELRAEAASERLAATARSSGTGRRPRLLAAVVTLLAAIVHGA